MIRTLAAVLAVLLVLSNMTLGTFLATLLLLTVVIIGITVAAAVALSRMDSRPVTGQTAVYQYRPVSHG